MSARDYLLHAAPEFNRKIRPLTLPEPCWADRPVVQGGIPTLTRCGADAVREGLCAACYRSIFGHPPPRES